MKYLLCLTALAVYATEVIAYPSRMFNVDMSEQEKRALSDLAARIESGIDSAPFGKRQAIIFDPATQYVSNTGANAFVAPGPDDLRGPCPGLNAMANHGYLPHNGVGTITEFVQGTYEVFGMGLDLGAFLSIYGAVVSGDLTSWSIGGPPSSSILGLAGGLLSPPQGISNSHNIYEGDASPTRGDLYEYGNDDQLVMSQFEELYNTELGPSGYDLTTLTSFRASRFQQSISNNPHFFNGPVTGVAVQPAAYCFIYRFMSNKSSEYPEGYLNGDVLKSFMSITGEPGSFVYTPGYEKIPDNWYKRAIGDEYGFPLLAVDVNVAGLQHPEFYSIGGNTDGVNSFTGVDISNLTGGVFSLENLSEGNNAACLAFQFAQQAAPDFLKGLFSSLTAPLAQLDAALGNVFTSLSCPELASFDTSQFSQYPGATGAY